MGPWSSGRGCSTWFLGLLSLLGREHRERVQIICLESQHTRGGQWRWIRIRGLWPKSQQQGNPEQGPHIHSTDFFHQIGLDCALKFQGENLPLILWFCNSNQSGQNPYTPSTVLLETGSMFPRAGLLQWLAWGHRSWTWFQTASRPSITHAHQIPGPCPWISRLIPLFSVWIVVTASRIQYTFQIAPKASSIFGHSLLSSRLGWAEWLVPSVQRVAWASEHSYIKIIWATWVYGNRLSLSLWHHPPPFLPSFIPLRPRWPQGSCNLSMVLLQSCCKLFSLARMVLALVTWLAHSLLLVLSSDTASQMSPQTTLYKLTSLSHCTPISCSIFLLYMPFIYSPLQKGSWDRGVIKVGLCGL